MGRYGVLTVGRLPLREDFTVSQSMDGSLDLAGAEASPLKSLSELVERRREDLLALAGRFVPVTFEKKPELNGYYWVVDVKADTRKLSPFAVISWTMKLISAGPDSAVDLEARLGGAITRQNAFTVTGNRWHAPPIGAYAYHTESTGLVTTTRDSSDGVVTVYRSIPLGVHPRYGCAVTDYGKGRVRFTDTLGKERVGVGFKTSATNGWTLSNGLVKVALSPNGSGTLRVSSWLNSLWVDKDWDVQSGSTNLEPFDALTVLRNDYELVTVRLLKSTSLGRRSVDLTLRRGSRFVEIFLRRSDAGGLGVKLHTPEAGTATSGYITATTDDANGLRYILGSANTFTGDVVGGGISVASQTKLDAFIGAVVPPSSPTHPNLGFEDPDINVSWVGTASIIASETGIKRTGNKSAKVTPGGSAVNPRIEGRKNVLAAVPNVSKFYVRAWVYPTTAWAQGFQVGANYQSVSNTWVASSNSVAVPNLPVNVWTMIETIVTAPNTAGIAWATPRIGMAGPAIPAATDIYYVDDVSIRPDVAVGDSASDLYAQYLGACGETEQGVIR